MIKRVSFRFAYIAWPFALLALVLAAVIYFYSRLPANIAYYFVDGSPDKWAGRETVTAWLLAPQVIFALAALGVVGLVTRLSRRFPKIDGETVKPLLAVMGNMFVLPQAILGLVMLDIFTYNAYLTHVIALLPAALAVMALGVIALGVYFVLALRRVWYSPARQASRSNPVVSQK
ncbi:MAG: hypothetical protein HYX96_05425 [Chloroflexi bacterium]|nr:hypothetical protein [Chloroflexota bacterium]